MTAPASPPLAPRIVGRYALHDEIALGGMASVHLGRSAGDAGFSRTVAIKRLHPQFAKNPDFAAMIVDEGRIAERIRHPNVVAVLDVVSAGDELLLVMEYVHGEAFAKLLATARAEKTRVAPAIVSGVMIAVLQGLHAAHEAKDARGAPLGIVHRDVSPENILVGADGVARVLDFGIAMAEDRYQTTRDGQLKGKLAYMAPEQLGGLPVSRATDVYAAGVVLWQALTGRKMFEAPSEAALLMEIVKGEVKSPRDWAPELPPEIDAVVMKAVARDPRDRYETADELAVALETAIPPATPRQIARWVAEAAKETLDRRSALLARIESVGDASGLSGSWNKPGRLSAPELPARVVPVDGTSAGATVSSAIVIPKKRVSPLVWVGLPGVIAVGVVLAFYMSRSTTPAASTGVVAAGGSPSTAIVGEPAGAARDVPTVVPSPVQSAAASASATASSTAKAAPPKPGKPVTPAANTPPAPGKNCNPDYYIDAKGVKRYKKECLR